jgi:hypothetical protein
VYSCRDRREDMTDFAQWIQELNSLFTEKYGLALEEFVDLSCGTVPLPFHKWFDAGFTPKRTMVEVHESVLQEKV